mmetsp:Transcript_11531/g.8040  ORF Transcript_11531/g.8040 Transcript_11531/m.8040 type:complete len:81 (+) Transcript_11531:185-427(+)
MFLKYDEDSQIFSISGNATTADMIGRYEVKIDLTDSDEETSSSTMVLNLVESEEPVDEGEQEQDDGTDPQALNEDELDDV